MKKAWVLSYPLSAQQRLWSDCAHAQADLSLCWAHTHFVGFVMSQFMSRGSLSDQHLCCSLPRQYNTSSFYIRNFKPLSSFSSCAGQFESTLVNNPEDRFSHDAEAHTAVVQYWRKQSIEQSPGFYLCQYFINTSNQHYGVSVKQQEARQFVKLL